MPETASGRVLFVGAVHEAAPALDVLLASPAQVVGVVTMPAGASTLAGASAGASASGFIDLEPAARAHGVGVYRVEDINSPAVVSTIAALAPDLIVVVGWTRLLGAPLLALPERGCVGFHASLLPRYRGRAPVNWAILNGETETGNTMFFLTAAVDTGDIIDQRAIPIRADDTCATVYEAVGAAGAGMLGANLAALLDGTAPRRPQIGTAAAAMPKRVPAMGITDWDREPQAVHNWIRALTRPYPGAFSRLGGAGVMLWSSALPRPAQPVGRPGELLACDDDGLQVGTRGGSLVVTQTSFCDGPVEHPLDWWRRERLTPGMTFEPVDPALARWALGTGPRPAAQVRQP